MEFFLIIPLLLLITIMPNHKLILLFICVMAATGSQAQDKEFTSMPTRGEYALVLYVSGGVGHYPAFTGDLAYLRPNISNINPVSNVRIMWHPDHLIKLGIETGYLTFLSYTLEDSAGNKGKVQVNAVPLLVEWSMSLTKRFNLFAGSGVYFMNTRLDYQGKTSSKKLSIGWTAAASYIIPLSEDVGLGTELKWLDAAESRDGTITLQLQLVWKFLRW